MSSLWSIKGTLSKEALRHVAGLKITYLVWEALKNSYAQDSQELEFTLQQQVTYLRKYENKTMAKHIHTFNGLCDNFLTIGKPVSDKEKVFYLLNSLGSQYQSFTITMMKIGRPSYIELILQLQSISQGRTWFSGYKEITPR